MTFAEAVPLVMVVGAGELRRHLEKLIHEAERVGGCYCARATAFRWYVQHLPPEAEAHAFRLTLHEVVALELVGKESSGE